MPGAPVIVTVLGTTKLERKTATTVPVTVIATMAAARNILPVLESRMLVIGFRSFMFLHWTASTAG